MIVVAGEALVDLVPRGEQLVPLLGGSPYNVAIGSRRLAVETSYLGRCSTDPFGRALLRGLEEEGVDLTLIRETGDPTTLAVVHLDEQGQASYGFYLQGTSAAGLSTTDLPELPAQAALHVSLGAITLDTEPAGRALRTLIEREAPRRVVSLDPNVRPAVIDDPARYAADLDGLLSSCALVKASEEDLAVLHPRRTAVEVALDWAGAGPALVVVTRGADGALAVPVSPGSRDGLQEVAAPEVQIVDTVGAGDAFTAGLLARLDELGRLVDRASLAAIGADELRQALEYAARVAALACTRAGADPPRRAELLGGSP